VSATDKRCVLVTGASGFVGKALVPALASQGWRIRAASRQPIAAAGADITWAPLPDLGRPTDWTHLLTGVDHVVHLAGIAHSRARLAEATYQRVNADASGELARAAAASGVTKFVLISSVRAQCGPSADGALSESATPAPSDAYGRSKQAAERLVATEFPDATLLRPVLILGPGVKGNLAHLQGLARLRVPLPFGALRNRRSLLGLANMVSIIAFCLTSERARGATYLAADPEPMSLRDLVAAMRQALGRQPWLVAVPPALLATALTLAGREALKTSLLGDLCVESSTLTAAGWRPVSTTRAEIFRMMAAAQSPPNSR